MDREHIKYAEEAVRAQDRMRLSRELEEIRSKKPLFRKGGLYRDGGMAVMAREQYVKAQRVLREEGEVFTE